MNETNLGLDISLRPTSFDELIGNEATLRKIKALLDSNKFPVGWMLVGEPGAGKTTLARIIARYVQGPDYADTSNTEILETNASSENGVDFARALANRCEIYPGYGAKWRVVILDEAHRLSKDAQNVLLKPVEENRTTMFIFCTTAPGKILPAIKSRCASTTFTIEALKPEGVARLVQRAIDADPFATYEAKPLVDALERAKIRAPRAVIKCAERYLMGETPEQATRLLVEDPELWKISEAVVQGKWHEAVALLDSLEDPEQLEGVLAILGGRLRGMLVKAQMGDSGDKIAECINILLNIPFEIAILKKPASYAAMYRVARRAQFLR